jgi:hypothetical protein
VLGRERFGPLTERPFRLLWLGRTCSSIGNSLIPVALAFAVLRIGGGATGLGIVLAARCVRFAGERHRTRRLRS